MTLAACSSEPVRTPPLQLDYTGLGKIYLNTQDVRIINRASGALARPTQLAHQFQPQLAEAVTKWAQDRLQATGTMGHATFIIKEASLVEQPLQTDAGMDSWFTRQQASKYLARVEVVLEAQSPENSAHASAKAYSVYAITLPEDPTDAEKNQAYRQLLDGLMHNFNDKFENAIRKDMRLFVTSEPSAAQATPMQAAPMQAMPMQMPPAGEGAAPAMMDVR